MITSEQLKEAIFNFYDLEEDDDDRSATMLAEIRYTASNDGVKLEGIGLVELEDEWGGEGEGDSLGFVLKVTPENKEVQYFELDGFWVSHDGEYWEDEDFKEVRPKEVPKIIWV